MNKTPNPTGSIPLEGNPYNPETEPASYQWFNEKPKKSERLEERRKSISQEIKDEVDVICTSLDEPKDMLTLFKEYLANTPHDQVKKEWDEIYKEFPTGVRAIDFLKQLSGQPPLEGTTENTAIRELINELKETLNECLPEFKDGISHAIIRASAYLQPPLPAKSLDETVADLDIASNQLTANIEKLEDSVKSFITKNTTKSFDEAAGNYANQFCGEIGDNEFEDGSCLTTGDAIALAFLAGSAHALQFKNQPAEKWVRVEDRLPEFGKKVLVHFGHIDNTLIAKLIFDDNLEKAVWGVFFSNGISVNNGQGAEVITHWQPLPIKPE